MMASARMRPIGRSTDVNGRRALRGVLLVASLGLALHLVLPQIPGLERSLRLIVGTSHLLVGAAFLAEVLSELCYAELLGRSVGTISRLGLSSRVRKRRGMERWFMFRLTVTGYGLAHVLPSHDEFVSASPANVAHTVFDAVVDEYLPIMNRLSAIVDGIEDELLAAGDASDAILDSLFHLKHELSALRRLAVPSRDIVGILMRPTVRLIPEDSQMYYDDVRDHLVRVIDMIDTMRDYLPGSLDIYTTQQTQRINRSMQRLTAIATIFLPLTFITGIYGMNFSYIPESNWRYGFFAVLALSTFLAVGMIVYLWRKKMI